MPSTHRELELPKNRDATPPEPNVTRTSNYSPQFPLPQHHPGVKFAVMGSMGIPAHDVQLVAAQNVRVGYNFEWDPGKAQANRKKHGVPFEEAVTVFGDPLSMKMPDPDHSESEQRISSLGYPNDIDFWLFATLKLKKKRESSARVKPRVLNERAMKKGKTKSSQGASPLEISSIGEGTTSVVP